VAEEASPEDLKRLVGLLREFRDWEQRDLARAAGLDPSSLSRYESGRIVPPRKALERLAAAVGVPMPLVDACLLPALKAVRLAMVLPERKYDVDDDTERLESALTGAARTAVVVFLATLESSRQPWERSASPSEADRSDAPELWRRLEPRNSDERRFLVETCREFQSWALAEYLCHESAAAGSDRASVALELAELAVHVAEHVPGEEAWRSRLKGYCLAFLASVRRSGNDLAGAASAFAEARRLWEAGASAEPNLLSEGRVPELGGV
jgi:transcriptional regulator with XRE-family HTH domain